MAEVVEVLDRGIMLSGAPGRYSLFETIFQSLEPFVEQSTNNDAIQYLEIVPPETLETSSSIPHAETAHSFEAFQYHLNHVRTPIIIPGALANWPALERWQQADYFLKKTLGGRRLVPVEIGKLYTDSDWHRKSSHSKNT